MRKEIVEALMDDAARREERRKNEALDRLHAERLKARRERNGNFFGPLAGAH
jgi:hypothetical protein